jgi:hypothetical protein
MAGSSPAMTIESGCSNVANAKSTRNDMATGSKQIDATTYPLFLNPAEIPLIVIWIPRSTCSSGFCARCSLSSSTWT